MTGNSPTSIAELEQWFSIPRMNTYRNSENPEGFYIWNTQLSKAYLEDIQHVEVLLRNRVDAQLRSARGPFWFEDDAILDLLNSSKKL
ncbi:hypothetical protein JJQ73_06780 [Corynebacterium glutamicum]|uniref:hypothetical protein n=1 Tax=Corynebacterium glutamicum TaxID=1718 RepID=UPI001C6ECDC1|nr:hypothetical protein [Corynebacterium glutamicum]QYR18709.1 hypothetical protein JJQ73_06780 [Corynebacterium glutamicum]